MEHQPDLLVASHTVPEYWQNRADYVLQQNLNEVNNEIHTGDIIYHPTNRTVLTLLMTTTKSSQTTAVMVVPMTEM
jgi:hypothetical protein